MRHVLAFDGTRGSGVDGGIASAYNHRKKEGR